MQLTSDEVRQTALAGNVRAHPDYHARQHHVSWEDCVYALVNCERVAPDHRLKHSGTDAFVAFGRISRSEVLRVDFQFHPGDERSTILVVTAIPY